MQNLSRLSLLLLVAGVILVGANAFVLSPILGDVARDLDTDPTRVARAISAFGVATAFSAFSFAGMVDRWGPRRVLSLGALLVAVAQIIGAASQSWQVLAASQLLAGLAVGVMLPATYSTATRTAAPGQETAQLGKVLTGWAVSLVAAVPLSAFITAHFGWRAIYGLLAALSLAVALGFALRMPALARPAAEGLEAGPRLNPLQALRLPGVKRILFVCLLFMTAFYGSFSYFGEGIRAAFGGGAATAGLYVMYYGIGFGLSGALIGKLGSVRARRAMIVLLLCIALNYVAMSFSLGHGLVMALSVGVWGFLNQFGLNAIIVLLNRAAPAAGGAVMGLHSTVTYLAVFLGPYLMSFVFRQSGFAPIPAIAGGLILVSSIFLLLSPRETEQG
ncbi:MFS transporter [Paracoccus aminophilus]|uniref:Major facilitator superfamily protein n=1 Tax=Paracoccus aminophilus JCM 7686 TaxID=1367847 RepID=S5XPV8_PARAH|nr:MFS transporter [Paracoccus aminophilus]AGT09384.1 major facilitator superfamily protein [Paracoccus aminophilus JCM 7686]